MSTDAAEIAREAAPVCRSLKRIEMRALALAGMTLWAGLPTSISVTSRFEG